jgi:hypothetical protein
MAAQPTPDNMKPNMLLLNAVQCGDPPHNARLVELLLQRGAALEEVDEVGFTALLSAVVRDKTEVRTELLLYCNLGLHACSTALLHAAYVLRVYACRVSQRSLQALLQKHLLCCVQMVRLQFAAGANLPCCLHC